MSLRSQAAPLGRAGLALVLLSAVLGAALPGLARAAPSASACRAEVDQGVDPVRLPLGGTFTATLRLSLDCQARRIPLAMALVLDRSSSMERADAIGRAREGALRLADRLRPGEDWATLVTFNEKARVDQSLTDVPALLRQAIGAVRAGGDTNISAGLAEGHKQLRRLAGRPYTRALVLLTDGKNESGAAAVTREAEALRGAGIYVATVGLGRDPERAILEAAATSPADAWFPRDPAELPAIFDRIGERWVSLQVREATVTDVLPPDLITDGATLPPGAEAPGATWTWSLPAVGLLPVEIRLRLRPTQLGLQPVSRFARLAWRDQAGQAGEAVFPVPLVDVYAPAPPATPGPGPTLTATPIAGASPTPEAVASTPPATLQAPAFVLCLPLLQGRGEPDPAAAASSARGGGRR